MSAYTDALDVHLEGLTAVSSGACPGCVACGEPDTDDEMDIANEGHFSWRSCDSCGSTLGGDRYAAHGIDDDDGENVHLDICVDCLMFLANGDEPEDWEA